MSTTAGVVLTVFATPQLSLPEPFNPIQILWVAMMVGTIGVLYFALLHGNADDALTLALKMAQHSRRVSSRLACFGARIAVSSAWRRWPFTGSRH
jgi:hypothetical protein